MTSSNLITAPVGRPWRRLKPSSRTTGSRNSPSWTRAGKLRGLITFKDIQKKKRHPLACKDNHGRLRVGGAVGVTPDTPERVAALIEAGVDCIVVDTAHGHSQGVLLTVKKLKAKFDIEIIAAMWRHKRRRAISSGQAPTPSKWDRAGLDLHDEGGCRSRCPADLGGDGMRQGRRGLRRPGDRRRRHQADGRHREGDRGGG